MRSIGRIALASLLGLAAPVAAQVAIPSCYGAIKIDAKVPPPDRAVFVLVDQTTPIDPPLRDAVRAAVGPLLSPGTSFSISSFSAFAQGHYQTPLVAGELEASVADRQRDSVSVRALTSLDRCLRSQLAFGRKAASTALDRAISGQSEAFAHSDVISSLVDLGHAVSASQAHDRIVIVVSDMLENSGLTSFYAHRAIRQIDPRKELQLAIEKGFRAEFHGARVYVIGAGALPGENSYRDPISMRALETFWHDYFAVSHATLVDFGKPMPTRPVR